MSTRRNPRRAVSKGVNLAEEHDDDDAASSSSASGAESDVESSDEEIVPVRRTKKSSRTTTKRTSSRSTRFQSSMEEPRDSIKDLLDENKAEEPSSSPRKTPAKSHSSARRKVHLDVDSESSEEEEEESDMDETQEEEGEPFKVQRIIASRSESRKVWKEICSKIHTSEIEYGSRWYQESDDDDNDDTYEERFLVKWSDVGYLHCSWETQQDLVEQVDGAKTYLSTFFKKSVNGLLFSADERCDGDYFDPAFVQIDRILEVEPPEGMEALPKKPVEDEDIVDTFGIVLDRKSPDFESGTGRQFLIKWKNTPYSEGTFEFERDLIINDVDYLDSLKSLEKRSKKPSKTEVKKSHKLGDAEEARLGDMFREDEEKQDANVKAYQDELAKHVFPNGGQLRDYQAEGVTWLASNFVFDRSSILCDEMGLGKTLQTAAFIDLVAKKLHRRGPFLIVAPLSTIPHWQREFTSWTDLNTIVYHGSQRDRELIREMEFVFPCDHPKNGVGFNQSFLRKCMPKSKQPTERVWMAQVVITTPEMMVTDDFVELAHVDWEVLVVDEAQKLKNHNSRLTTNLRDRKFDFGHTLLLTGTPIQNNMSELWTLLAFVDPEEFGDMDDFLEKYGDIKSKEGIDDLHEKIRPYILRRLKEDVEKSVPPKEETLIEVELTVLQKQYYRALYEKNVQFLHKNKTKALDGPSLNNLAMQLRKCCNHPFLLNGVEEDVREQERNSNGEPSSEGDFLVKASGKLVLLDKLLPRLKTDGHRVLIFSQFKIMLDILEDYLAARQLKFERIDGSITGNKRQMAIDRFQAAPVEGKEPPLVMLLSTRAGGVGINLTAADTCIIFDSDWNPQNDLQAQARCHRIGQTKNVKVYRLLSRKTYEMQMFHMSSLKMGLDQAVLQGFESGSSGEGAMTKEEVERLLRHGAYDIFNEEKAGSTDAESSDFLAQDIDSILERRSRTVVHDQTGSNSSAAGGTFSKASFKAAPKTPSGSQGKAQEAEDVDIDDPEFWTKMVGEAKVEDKGVLTTGKKRSRKQTHYSETAYDKQLDGTLLLSGPDSSDDSDSESDEWSVQDAGPESDSNEEAEGQPIKKLVKRKKERTKWGGSKANQWDKKDAEKLLKTLQSHGYANVPWAEFLAKASIDTEKLDTEEVKRMCWAMLLFSVREAADDDAQNAKRRAQRKAEKQREAREAEAADAATKESGGVLGSNLDELVGQNDLGEQLNVSFKKIVDANATWLSKALQDATDYAKAHSPRTRNALARSVRSHSDGAASPQSLQTLFATNMWPSLKSRGWTAVSVVDGEFGGTICYSYSGNEYRSPHAVLVAVPQIHPELEKVVESILASTGCTPDWKESEILEAKRLQVTTISASSVSTFLDMFAPTQLLVDRRKHKKLSMHRKVLGTCTSLFATHAFVRQASEVPGSLNVVDKLANGLIVSKLIGKPHPSWTSRHDAVLITAIAKHGWIDQDSACRKIIEDDTIKWGAPFDDDGHASDQKEASRDISKNETDLDLLRETAREAADFLNVEHTLVDEMKGFNQSAIVKAFGLVQPPEETDLSLAAAPSNPQWTVDDKLLLQNLCSRDDSAGSDDAMAMEVEVDLPTRKDLLKRAKTVLARASFSSQPPAPTVAAVPAQSSASGHDFAVLDQSDPCNVFLAEMLRGLLKASFVKSSAAKKTAKHLCSNALREARRLCDGVKKRTSEHDSGVKELDKIANHIRLVSRTMATSPRPTKNVLRAVLGETLVMPKNALESIFPYVGNELTFSGPGSSAASNAAANASAARKKARTTKKDESPAGNRALSRAVAKGFDKNKEAQGKFSEASDQSTLELTASETLLLTILVNQGLPVWNDEHVKALLSESGETDDLQLHVPGDHVILWKEVAEHFKASAAAWVEQASARLQRYQIMTITDSNREKRTTDIREAEREDAAKRQALAHAKHDVGNPLKFARKCLLLLEAVRLHMGPIVTQPGDTLKKRQIMSKSENGLGPVVLSWLRKDTTRWAKSLAIVDGYDQPMSSTIASTAREGDDFTLFAIMSKQHCRAVYGQIAQQTRTRSIFVFHNKEETRSFVDRATRQSRSMEDVWDDKPVWWNNASSQSSIHDHDLLCGLVSAGYSEHKEIFSSSDSFMRGKENHQMQQMDANDDDDQDIYLSKKAVQIRANQLTRELHSHMDSLEAARLLGKKKDRLSGGSESLLASAAHKGKENSATGNEVQTGIEAFFSASKPAADSKKPASAKKPADQVVDLCDSDDVEVVELPKQAPSGGSDSEVEVVAPPPPKPEAVARSESSDVEIVSSPSDQDASAKRKESPSAADSEARCSPEKKSKVEVVAPPPPKPEAVARTESSDVEVTSPPPGKQDASATSKRKESPSEADSEAPCSPEKKTKLV